MKDKTLIGRVEEIALLDVGSGPIAARIDTGAKTSALWATSIREDKGKLSYILFGKESEFYNGKKINTKTYSKRSIASSSGHIEERYVVKHLVLLKSRRVKTSFTLTNRSEQAYPILLGRNILRGKFIVDVKLGKPHQLAEKSRSAIIQANNGLIGKDK
jgi:hypothetical protein